MSNCNSSPSPMVEGLNQKTERPDFISDAADITSYKKFTESVQWLACQTLPDIIQMIAKLSQKNVKPLE